MGRLTTLIVGGLVGAGLALAYAPRSGAETRERVAQKVNQVWEEAQGVAPVSPEQPEREYQEVPVAPVEPTDQEPAVEEIADSAEPASAAEKQEAEPEVASPDSARKAAPEVDFAQSAQQIRDFAQAAAVKGQEFAQAAAERAPEIAAKATEYAQSVVGNVVNGRASDDDLRDRIEAARARIAAQVMKNAQESSAAVAESAPEPVVDVEPVSEPAE